jgi:hypothetical protein
MRGDGRVFKRGARWWFAYYAPRGGKALEYREPAFIVERVGEDRGRRGRGRRPCELSERGAVRSRVIASLLRLSDASRSATSWTTC